MNIDTGKTVRELVLEMPNAVRVFEKLGIDYCCGGSKTLQEACTAANLSSDEVLESISDVEPATSSPADRNWQAESLADLVAHILSIYISAASGCM